MDFLEVQRRAESVREMYLKKTTGGVNVLLYGDFGTGKTTFFKTCPKPVFIDSFDPSGTITKALRPMIESGDIIVETKWEGDSWKNPFAFQAWEKEMEDRIKTGFFEHFGTYGLDSLTRMAESCMFRVCEKGNHKGEPYQKQDYNVQQLTVVDWLGRIATFPCHTVVTGHIGRFQDEVSGAIETGLLLAGKLSDKVCLAFVEKWVSRVVKEGGKQRFVVQTHQEGIYKAETRIGGSDFQTFEEPDFKALLRKAGLKQAAEDKPSLFKE